MGILDGDFRDEFANRLANSLMDVSSQEALLGA